MIKVRFRTEAPNIDEYENISEVNTMSYIYSLVSSVVYTSTLQKEREKESCSMTPGLSKDIGVMYDHTFDKRKSADQTSGHTKLAVSLAILHMVTSIFLRGLCGYIWVNILTLSP